MKIGCDIVEIDRFIGESDVFYKKYFTEYERDYVLTAPHRLQTAAGIFAVKEATLKALGEGAGNGIALIDIVVTHDKNGAPHVYVKNLDAEFSVSISHTDKTAMAVCIVL